MFRKRLLPLLCAAALTLTLFGGMVSAQDAEPQQEATLNSIDAIIERDGYLEGIWFPWFNHVNLGHGLTSNELMVEYVGNAWGSVGLDDYGPDNIYQQIYNLKALGFNIMGYEGSIYSEGVVLDERGDVLGIKEEYLYNVRRFLDICRAVEMPILWTVCCHSTSVNDYYEFGKMAWDKMTRYYHDKQVADHYAERFVAPLCEVLAEYPDVVVMVAATVEAENEINDSAIGNNFGGGRSLYGVNQDDMLYFIKQINDTVAKKLPNVTRTIGSQLADMSVYRDIDFDIIGDQNYNYAGNSDDISGFNSPVPMFVSEFGLGFEQRYDDDTFSLLQLRFRDNFRADGFKGWMMWCWSTDRDQPGSTFSWLKYPSTGVTDFRSSAYDLRYYVQDYRNEHRGETDALDIPDLLCNIGDGKVEWFASRQAKKLTLSRSDDGGNTWVPLLEEVDPTLYETDGKGVYRDTTAPITENTVYRITVWDDAGNTASSQSNLAGMVDAFATPYSGDPAPAYDWGDMPFKLSKVSASQPLVLTELGVNANRPIEGANLILHSDFETVGGQWNTDTFLSDRVTVVEDPTAPEGEHSLFFDTTDTATAEWHSFSVDVEPNTDYIFSVWVKGDQLQADNQGYATTGVMDPATGRFIPYTANAPYYTQAKQIVPTAWDGQWHLRSVMFNSGNRTSVEVGLFGCRSRMWLDGMALYVNGMGIRYNSDNMMGSMRVSMFGVDSDSCLPTDSVIFNPTMEDTNSNYWQTGSGWKSGFMSLAESDDGYGTSLKYTATEKPLGLCYIKWINVTPHTDYILSFDMNVLEEGAGMLVLMDGKLRNINPQMAVEFSKEVYGDSWFRMAVSVNSGAFSTVGIGVVDNGGSALMDNIRLYEKANGADVTDLYLDSVTATKSAAYGKNASVTVNAQGDGLKYAWYYKDKGASKFSLTTSFTGKTYSIAMNEARDGRQVYCVVTDKYGYTRTTETVTLSLKKTALKITTQPKTSTYVKDGATAKVTVKAQGDGLKYTWYYKNAGKTSYSKSSVTSATYSTKMSASASDRRLYCVVTDAYGNSVKTNTVLIRRQVAITKQPATAAYAKNGAKASVKITANGDGLKYTWYVKNAGASKYTKSSITSATYSATMSSTVKDRRVYCVVTDKYGKTVKSETFVLRMSATITTQPKTVTVKKNATAKLTVKAKGDGLKYTWYYKNSDAKKYTKVSGSKSTYSVKMTSKVKNRTVYVVVTDKYGNKVTSKTVKLKMK